MHDCRFFGDLVTLEECENKVVFFLNEKTFDFSQANKIRRFLIRDIPVYAVDTISVYKNSSAFTDEFLIKRIELIPVNPKNKEEVFELKKTGICRVYSDDISDVFFPGIIITELQEGQEIFLRMSVRKGTFAEHVKFQTCHVGYKKEPNGFQITIHKEGYMSAIKIFEKMRKKFGL